jgi:hypothetical protein
MPEPQLVSIEFRFVSSEDAEALAERVRESARMIVAPSAVEDFKVRTMPINPPKKPLRGVN